MLPEKEVIAEYVNRLNALFRENFTDSSGFDHFKFRYDNATKDQYSAMILVFLFEREYLRIQEKIVYELVVHDIHP